MLPPLKLRSKRMIYVFIGLWFLLTGMMFFAAKNHNRGTDIDYLKVKYEPYVFSVGLAMMLTGLIGLVT
jgi:hypothetical protein